VGAGAGGFGPGCHVSAGAAPRPHETRTVPAGAYATLVQEWQNRSHAWSGVRYEGP
jgi:hypothetical protein